MGIVLTRIRLLGWSFADWLADFAIVFSFADSMGMVATSMWMVDEACLRPISEVQMFPLYLATQKIYQWFVAGNASHNRNMRSRDISREFGSSSSFFRPTPWKTYIWQINTLGGQQGRPIHRAFVIGRVRSIRKQAGSRKRAIIFVSQNSKTTNYTKTTNNDNLV